MIGRELNSLELYVVSLRNGCGDWVGHKLSGLQLRASLSGMGSTGLRRSLLGMSESLPNIMEGNQLKKSTWLHTLVSFGTLVIGFATGGGLAVAQDFYVVGQLGAIVPQQVQNADEIETHIDPSFAQRVALGTAWRPIPNNESLAAYLEVSASRYQFDLHGLNLREKHSATGDLNAYDVFTNMWIGYRCGPFEIVAGGGIGVSLLDVSDYSAKKIGLINLNDSDYAASFNVGGGIYYDLSDRWQLGLMYIYKDIPSYKIGDYHGQLTTNSLFSGLRFHF